MEKLKDVYKQYVSKVCLIKGEILRICFVYEYIAVFTDAKPNLA